MERWQDVSDEEFISRSKDYSSRVAYARSYGLKLVSPGFRNRIDGLGLYFTPKVRVSREEFAVAVNKSTSITEVASILNGGIYKRSYYSLVHRLSKEYGIPLPKYIQTYIPKNKIPDDEYFVKGVKRSGPYLRDRLIADGRIYRCDVPECPLHKPEKVIYIDKTPKVPWAGKFITIQVDHIDGDNLNNLESNLRFLCPNCHAATDTFTGKNVNRGTRVVYNRCMDCAVSISKEATRCRECATRYLQDTGLTLKGRKPRSKKIEYPDIDTIVRNIEDMGYSAYSRAIGVSDNAIRKHLTRNGVTPLPRMNSSRRGSRG